MEPGGKFQPKPVRKNQPCVRKKMKDRRPKVVCFQARQRVGCIPCHERRGNPGRDGRDESSERHRQGWVLEVEQNRKFVSCLISHRR